FSSSAQARSSTAFPSAMRAYVMAKSPATTAPCNDERNAKRAKPAKKKNILSCFACLAAFAFHFSQRFVEDPDRGLRFPARQHERRREADRVLPRAQHQQPAVEHRRYHGIPLPCRALLRLTIAHQLHADHQ